MILGFSTQINGKPTYLVEKIHAGLVEMGLFTGHVKISFDHPDFDVNTFWNCKPKLHTIREDKTKRWKAGMKIDFFINVRKKDMFRFAPVLPVVSVQKIEIKWIGFSDGFRPWVKIDGKNIYTIDMYPKFDTDKMLLLAQNDGFDTIDDFFAYFDKDFTGKIIHWTDLKY